MRNYGIVLLIMVCASGTVWQALHLPVAAPWADRPPAGASESW